MKISRSYGASIVLNCLDVLSSIIILITLFIANRNQSGEDTSNAFKYLIGFIVLFSLAICVILYVASFYMIKHNLSPYFYILVGSLLLMNVGVTILFLYKKYSTEGDSVFKEIRTYIYLIYLWLFLSSLSFFIIYSININVQDLRQDSNEQIAIWVLSLIGVCVSIACLCYFLYIGNGLYVSELVKVLEEDEIPLRISERGSIVRNDVSDFLHR